MTTCWKCQPDTWCVRSTSDLCDEHREPERERLRALKEKYAHLSLEDQRKLWLKERRTTRPPAQARGGEDEGVEG